MTIQLPVILWTVICFSVLYFILKYLLFLPVLSVMDARRKKMDDFDKVIKERQLELEQLEISNAAERDRLIREYAEKAKSEAEKVQMEGKRMLEDAKKERFVVVENHRKKTEEEFASDLDQAKKSLDKTADLFFSRLFAE